MDEARKTLGGRRVLVTGSSGRIGRIVGKFLGETYELSGLDRAEPDPPMPALPTVIADLMDLDRIRPAFEGLEAVVHLAADPRVDAPWEAVLTDNIVATRNVFEASRLEGVRRIVFASSIHVVGTYEREEPYASMVRGIVGALDPDLITRLDHTVPIRPDGYYGASKAFGEALGRYFWDRFGVEVICLRIGSVLAKDDPTTSQRFGATWCSHRDFAQLLDRCLSHPHLGFEVFYAVSNNRFGIFDFQHAVDRVGYRPRDGAGA